MEHGLFTLRGSLGGGEGSREAKRSLKSTSERKREGQNVHVRVGVMWYKRDGGGIPTT